MRREIAVHVCASCKLGFKMNDGIWIDQSIKVLWHAGHKRACRLPQVKVVAGDA